MRAKDYPVFLFQKSLNPNLPENLAISFYIQSYKLVLAVYQLENAHGSVKYETQQAECSIPWLNEALVLLTIALQLCQRLKDKVCIAFSSRIRGFQMKFLCSYILLADLCFLSIQRLYSGFPRSFALGIPRVRRSI